MTNEQTTGLPAGIEKDSQAHVDWLMNQRVICLGKEGSIFMPGHNKKTGSVIDLHYHPMPWNKGTDGWHIPQAVFGFIIFPDDFPHLFRRLSWWEHRSKEQMPGYFDYHGLIGKSDKPVASYGLFDTDKFGSVSPKDCLPATRAEYEAQQEKLNQQQ